MFKFSQGVIQIKVHILGLVLLLAWIVIGVLFIDSLNDPQRNLLFLFYPSGEKSEKLSTSCNFSDKRSEVCEIKGDIHIHGASSSISLINPHFQEGNSKIEEIVRIRPYPRKVYPPVMEIIGEIRITSMSDSINIVQKCNVNHSIPAVIFSNGGFLGNFYHDFDDCLIPLFITSRQFDGEVQFLINNMQRWWINKYKEFFTELTNYELINLKDERIVHCYPHVIVNLYSHKNISIDPSRAPNNYSSIDFAEFLRKTYSLDRDIIQYNTTDQRKPRLLIITRNRTRRFTSTKEIVSLAENLGFEVVAQEKVFNIANFSKNVNSFDVMMGVHGAGLTNFMFLPDNAILIQIALLGKLNEIETFGLPAIDRKLRYLQYDISENESTLSEIYPKDHPVFTDPYSYHRQGFAAVEKIYLSQQNVRLNVTRFRPVLERALELLEEQ